MHSTIGYLSPVEVEKKVGFAPRNRQQAIHATLLLQPDQSGGEGRAIP
jgi:hypothetical protein